MHDEELMWQWAHDEQLRLFDKHDAYYLDELPKENCSDDIRCNFLKDYSLIRGQLAKVLFGKDETENTKICRRKQFFKICDDNFKNLRSQGIGNLDKKLLLAWENCSKNVQETLKFNAPSATSKVLWFYCPKNWIMYDSHNNRALRKIVKLENTDVVCEKAQFIQRFEKFLENNSPPDSTSLHRTYPYELRLVEKFLWFKGSQNKCKILRNYKLGQKKIAPQL